MNEAEQRLYIKNLHSRIMKMMDWGEDKAWEWIGLQNPLLGYVSPAEMVLLDRTDKLDKFVDQAEEEIKLFKERESHGQ